MNAGGVKARCYVPPGEWSPGGLLTVSGDEAHHLLHVLRIRPGMEVSCFDGRGMEGLASVSSIGHRQIFLEIVEKRQVRSFPWEVSLGAAIPRHGKLDQILDQATQLGASRVIPLVTTRGVVKITPQESAKKLSRWSQIVVESGKQAEVSYLPEVLPATPWDSAVKNFADYDRVLLAAVDGPHEEMERILSFGNPRRLLVLIGPEGDFTPEEIRQACAAGARRFSLGPTVLRCDTAAVVALGLLFYLLRKGSVQTAEG